MPSLTCAYTSLYGCSQIIKRILGNQLPVNPYAHPFQAMLFKPWHPVAPMPSPVHRAAAQPLARYMAYLALYTAFPVGPCLFRPDSDSVPLVQEIAKCPLYLRILPVFLCYLQNLTIDLLQHFCGDPQAFSDSTFYFFRAVRWMRYRGIHIFHRMELIQHKTALP